MPSGQPRRQSLWRPQRRRIPNPLLPPSRISSCPDQPLPLIEPYPFSFDQTAPGPMQPVRITRITLQGLFGRETIDVPITDNKIILAGVNGIGKSTFINAFYYFLSRHWSRLLQYDFVSISVHLNGIQYELDRSEIESFETHYDRLGTMHPRYRRMFEQLTQEGELENFVASSPSRDYFHHYSDTFRLTLSELERFRSVLRRQIDLEGGLFTHKAQALLDAFKAEITSRLLYLPTYRRIEHDLSFIFPGLDEEIQRYQRRSAIPGRRADHYLELVSFGMEDVQENIAQTLLRLKEDARTTMNGLAAIYLRDVIRGEAAEFDRSIITALDEHDVAGILDRVEERTLSERDKQTLREMIAQLQKKRTGRLRAGQKYVAHFFSRLVEAANRLKDRETPVRQFVDICNKYLEGKRVVYDDLKYTVTVEQDGRAVELGHLSSGEKQIVSLFSHLLLQEDENYIIIIDEPELSLSTPWQKNFLPDVIDTGRCDGLIAVTHSPFIFDNKLRAYANDLRRYTNLSTA
jgi:AAA domain, putative AbiEii toxin, Type IV TA system